MRKVVAVNKIVERRITPIPTLPPQGGRSKLLGLWPRVGGLRFLTTLPYRQTNVGKMALTFRVQVCKHFTAHVHYVLLAVEEFPTAKCSGGK